MTCPLLYVCNRLVSKSFYNTFCRRDYALCEHYKLALIDLTDKYYKKPSEWARQEVTACIAQR